LRAGPDAGTEMLASSSSQYIPVIIAGLMCGVTIVTTVVICVLWRRKG